MARKEETQIQIKLAEYIAENYPDVEFHSDYGSGARLRPYQAKEQSRLNAGRRAWPDVFIAEPKVKLKSASGIAEIKSSDGWCGEKIGTLTEDDLFYDYDFTAGLFIELKKDGTRIFKKDGTLVADEHIREQFDKLESLRRRGYCAEFACGLEEAKKLVDKYLAE